MPQITTVVGARPNFIKLAALNAPLSQRSGVQHRIIHTGQHYDFEMSELFFQELALPTPHHHLGVGSDSQAQQVGRTMMALEPVLEAERPDWVVVVGDVNATAATAMVAKKMGLRLAHVEAGLRSFDWDMPEEINRVVTDRLSDLLFVSEPSGIENLRREGVEERRIQFVGNVMVDTLFRYLPIARRRGITRRLDVAPGAYAVATIHRPSNTDSTARLLQWMRTLDSLSQRLPIVFPVHPRTRKRLAETGFAPAGSQLKLVEPLGYLDMVGLLSEARLVMTDSGGIQEETTALGVPCLTLRENTERPVTVTAGTNHLVGSDPERLTEMWDQVLQQPERSGTLPEKWDGQAAARIVDILLANLDMPLRQR